MFNSFVKFFFTRDQLNKINTALADFGSELEYLKPPEFQPEYESLRGKKVVMVDDVFGVIENILPEIVVATDGNARGIHYKGQSLQELAADILSKKPDVIILDYHLSDYLKGIEVAKELSKIGFTGKIVGYLRNQHFMRRRSQRPFAFCQTFNKPIKVVCFVRFDHLI